MRVAEIQVPASRVRGVGPATAERFRALGVETVGDLLTFWPRDWDDRTVRVPLSRFDSAQKITALATVVAHEWFGFGRMRTLKIVIEDAEGTRAELACFNRPFLERQFPVGSEIVVHGSFQIRYGAIQSSAFEIDLVADSPARVLPVYPLTAGLTQAQVRKAIANALAEYGRGIDSELPESVRAAHGIPPKREILRLMHESATLADAARGRDALIFEELFLFEYAIGTRSLERRGRLPALAPSTSVHSSSDNGAVEGAPGTASAESGAPAEPCLSPLQARLVERLPFSLTRDQLAALSTMNDELSGDLSMARLLQGDVGSGKTLVAFLACLAVVERGGQCAILAPTELLARQHAENAARLLEPIGVRLAFLTGNVKASGRARLLEELRAGNIDVVIGTHALFSSGVAYRNLRLAVIDEQHRFGVLQRSAIIEKGIACSPERKEPHLLMMSATPIPRTLALSVFGDLDVSVIATLPPGRKPIVTHLARMGNEEKVYEFVARELSLGRQAYFVYPLIGQGEDESIKSAEDMFARLRDAVFPGASIALIHSKVAEDEQRRIMGEFRSGTVKILVATSVVEVGVDVANATCMVIEHAERFGLSALHQLRGRVGRGELQSWCFLVYAQNLTEDAKARLKVMHETHDGFVIAEEDLRIRGPGDVAGIEQSGYLSFSIADPVRDAAILERAREAAFSLLEEERAARAAIPANEPS
jgi:ATP-dependent DNA helicase RecG